ncbi:hypothetical protein DDE82_001865 [Stemphylium lycopersici]|nr:hypothetical protein DDE82_001865 [Stemphylium lycopersici]
MVLSPPSSGIRIVCDLFTRNDKDKVPSELEEALSLLQLSGLDGLEERFLRTEAFLKPWSVFRDLILLLQPDAMPRATAIATGDSDKGISRVDLLWSYTQFDEDTRRYDPRMKKYSVEYTPDSSVYGFINKRDWHTEDYEKHLFVWLLQAFKVGKARNPWGFDFFELRSICTAWQEVFVPIVNAVRASYSGKGRRHYGRLALFVEERCPSGLAFPKDNINISEGGLMSPTPYRIVSVPKSIDANGATFHKRTERAGVLTRKHYDEAEKELRNVYPQYGGLVERPKFKHKMEEWLEEQRARANLRKVAEQIGEVEASQIQVVKSASDRSPMKKISPAKDRGQEKGSNDNRIKRYSDSVRRSLSRNISKKTPKEEPKSPLHGVTRQLYIPDDSTPDASSHGQDVASTERHVSCGSVAASDTTTVTPWPRPDPQRKPSVQSVYSLIRNSNPFDLSDELQLPRVRTSTDEPVYSSMGQLSAIPQPLHQDSHRDQEALSPLPLGDKRSHTDVRFPSYEGSGWEDEISLTKLEIVQKESSRTPQPLPRAKPPTRLPVPIQPTPYTGNLQVALEEKGHDARPKSIAKFGAAFPRTVAWPGTSTPNTPAWSRLSHQDDDVPPLPTKYHERWDGFRNPDNSSRPEQGLHNGPGRSMARIVSKENIRSALGRTSRDSSAEDLSLPPSIPMIYGPSLKMKPGAPKLQTYNANLFPRREERAGTPVGAWVGAPKSRNTTEKSYRSGEPRGGEKAQD